MNKERWRLFPKSEGTTPYFSLANIIIPTYFLFQEPPNLRWLGFVLFILYVFLFRQMHFYTKWATHLLFAQVGILLVLAATLHPVYVFLGFMIAPSLSKLKLPLLISTTAAFVIGLGVSISPYWEQGGVQLWIGLFTPLFGVCVLPYIIRASNLYQQKSSRLRADAAGRTAQQEERQRIASELHDTLGHTLSLIALKGEVVEKLITRNPERALQEAREIRETARGALKQMRELVTEMKVAYFVDEYYHALSLCSAAGISLTFYYQSVSNGGNTSTYMEKEAVAEITLPLTPLQETILAMCFRETVTNVVRHSRASSCQIYMEIEDGEVRAVVKDDGVGADPEKLYTSSNGMAGLRQRLLLIDGQMSMSSSPGKGTEITLHIPRVIRNEKVGAG
ncbi:sensor histidine kinase [Paenibacillus arenosi]|uniref:histidine kinase n=1 Tax=Paenibacillus arenosi TaxID=2774142 RepID=A0ABR9B4G8_9BACL|nr:sensor histidine kinase [Paenibacillus arenosi]MBD8500317.1 sensor histidine kinase [Paenibacillus arenosi]